MLSRRLAPGTTPAADSASTFILDGQGWRFRPVSDATTVAAAGTARSRFVPYVDAVIKGLFQRRPLTQAATWVIRTPRITGRVIAAM